MSTGVSPATPDRSTAIRETAPKAGTVPRLVGVRVRTFRGIGSGGGR